EQQVVFEAVAAAPVANQLFLEIIEVEGDAATENDIEILERDRQRVCSVERDEGVDGWVERASEADAGEVGVDIEPIDGPFVARRRGEAGVGGGVLVRGGGHDRSWL